MIEALITIPVTMVQTLRGQKQRLGLLGRLENDMIILDEPTAALDTATENDFPKSIKT